MNQTKSIMQLIVSFAILTIALTHNVMAQIRTTVPRYFSYEISAQRIGSGDIIEFTPMNISWKMTVKISGWSGPIPTPVDVSICPVIISPDYPFQCPEIHNAALGRTYQGTMTVPAPPAGKQSLLRVVVVTPPTGAAIQGDAVSETSVPVDVAARYDVSIASFDLLTTRSNSTDTVWLTVQGMINSVPQHASGNPEACHLAGFNWCIFNQRYGDVHNSGVRILNNFRVGSYDLVPEREKDLRIMFYLDNHADDKTAEKIAAVANAFSKAGMLILSGYTTASGGGGNSFPSELDKVMEGLHNVGTGSCDGKLAEDLIIVPNTTIANQPQNTLDAFTRNNGTFTSAVLNGGVPKIYHETDGDFICDKRGGQYKVTYAVYRTSWRDWGFRPQW